MRRESARWASSSTGWPRKRSGWTAHAFTHDQTLFQKAQNTIFQVMAGGKLVIGAGLVESSFALDPVQLVLDNEIMVIARRWTKGFAVNEATLAVEALSPCGAAWQLPDR